MFSEWFNNRICDLQKFCCRILKSGSIPRHVALIMDGNRRYARQKGLNSIIDGHSSGFDALSKTLEWCKELGITEVTVYAFSIENFKRSETEVTGLMDSARDKLNGILKQMNEVDDNGVRFNFFGNLSMMPSDIQKLIAAITVMSAKNTRFQLNICIAYTSYDEMNRAVQTLYDAVKNGDLLTSDIDENLVSNLLDTGTSSHPDLLIRTSGESRFSDFLLYQTSYSCLYFDDVLWPDYNFWHLFRAILYYQLNIGEIENVKNKFTTENIKTESEKDTRIRKYLNMIRQKRWDHFMAAMKV